MSEDRDPLVGEVVDGKEILAVIERTGFPGDPDIVVRARDAHGASYITKLTARQLGLAE